MTNARAISAQLVDIRNVGTHKCVKLTIHAPEEQALRIMELFGWPTGAAPVPVALARLNDAAAEQPPRQDNQSVASSVPAGVDKPRRKFEELTPAQQAGILCGQLSFRVFLNEQFRYEVTTAEEAAEAVRELCKVKSRALLTTDNADWSGLLLAFRLWESHPELEDA